MISYYLNKKKTIMKRKRKPKLKRVSQSKRISKAKNKPIQALYNLKEKSFD